MSTRNTLLLRIAIAFAFLYPPIDSFFNPNAWISFFPPFMLGYLPNSVMLLGWGIVEAIIAFWILSGKRIFWPSLAATIALCTIVLFNLAFIEIVFRDIALALVAATLALWSYQDSKR